MKCIYCDGVVSWQYPMYDGVSKCKKCGRKNCHKIDDDDDDDDLEELDNE